jgi:hypothetical protein
MALQAKYENGVLELTDLREEGGAIVRCRRGGYCDLFEVPQYGGEERFAGSFTCPVDALELAAKWT